jgi:hypothetical protein
MSNVWFCVSCKHSDPIVGVPDLFNGLFGNDVTNMSDVGVQKERYCPKCGKPMFQVEDKSSG